LFTHILEQGAGEGVFRIDRQAKSPRRQMAHSKCLFQQAKVIHTVLHTLLNGINTTRVSG